jgi:protein ImuB
MRIACLHLPAFPLQVVLRGAPHRRGAAIAVVARTGVMPTVVACSRAARAAGIAVGMAAAIAREIAPGCEIVTADPGAEREVARAIADALLAVSPRVDVGGAPSGSHHAIYAEVPARMRGATFGARIRALCETMGVSGRVGIADDRFTARVAASSRRTDTDGDGVISVPRGGSAAFLAPLPLSLLAISGEVQHMLETLGVHTLGEFAALPPPEVARPEDADWQALARGEGGAALAAYAPKGPIVERIALDHAGAPGPGGLVAVVGELAARVAARLAGRGQAAAAIAVDTGVAPPIELAPDAPLSEPEDLARAIAARIGGGAPSYVEVRITPIELGAPLEASDGVVAAPVLAEASVPLTLVPDLVPVVPRAPHRRTRRGKERSRITPGAAQPGLFGALELRAR